MSTMQSDFNENINNIMKYAPYGCILINAQRHIVHCNNNAVELFTANSKEEILNKNFEEYFAKEQSNKLCLSYFAAQTNEEQKNNEDNNDNNREENIYLDINCIDGTYKSLEAICMPITRDNQSYWVVHLRELQGYYQKWAEALEEKRCLETRLQSMIDHMPLVCNTFNADFEIIDCNLKAVEMWNFQNKQEFIDRFPEISPPFQECGTPSMEKAVYCIRRAFEEGYYSFEWMDQQVNGDPMPSFVTLIRFEWKREFFVVAFIQDLRGFYQFKETERIAKERLQTMLDSSPLACFVIEEDFQVTEVNKVFVSLLGMHSSQDSIDLFIKLSPSYQPDGTSSEEKCRENLGIAFDSNSANFEWMFYNKAKELIPCEVIMVRVKLEGRYCVITFIRDLRDIKNATLRMKQMEMLAYTDNLTGIYNRRYFMDSAENEMAKCLRYDTPFSVIMIDIDFFKVVNDTYGHSVGDEVLKILTIRMNSVVKRNTLIARYGGEEFIILLAGVNQTDAENVAWRIQRVVDETKFNAKEITMPITVSLGVCTASDDIKKLEDIIDRADKALYKAKSLGRNTVVVYDYEDCYEE